ncbi:MAG: hypothetical protein JKY23_04430 [Nitrospinaceae bacterium]|nr:hypothetical protein [Nitrospinaceae bacterium]
MFNLCARAKPVKRKPVVISEKAERIMREIEEHFAIWKTILPAFNLAEVNGEDAHSVPGVAAHLARQQAFVDNYLISRDACKKAKRCTECAKFRCGVHLDHFGSLDTGCPGGLCVSAKKKQDARRAMY